MTHPNMGQQSARVTSDTLAALERAHVVAVLDAWAEQSDNRYYETDKMGFDAVGLGVGRQWRCNCFEVEVMPGREIRKKHVANGLSYESAADARSAAAKAIEAGEV